MTRRLLFLIGLLASFAGHGADALPEITLFAPMACQPCANWAQQMRNSGFVVLIEEKEPHTLHKVKRWLNVPSAHESVHTARVAGYFLEGPVPADDVLRLLESKPPARGLVSTDPAAGRAVQTLLVAMDGSLSRFVQH